MYHHGQTSLHQRRSQWLLHATHQPTYCSGTLQHTAMCHALDTLAADVSPTDVTSLPIQRTHKSMPHELQPMNIPNDCIPLHITRTIRTITSAPPQPMPTHICFRCHIAITVRMNLDVFPVTSDSLQKASAAAASKHIMCWSHRLSHAANRLHKLTSLHSAHWWSHNSITTRRSVSHAQQSSNARS